MTTHTKPLAPLEGVYKDHRGVTKAVHEFFGVKIADDEKYYPYGSSAAKARRISTKEFWSIGAMKDAQPLFGMDKFSAGQAMAITVTEGEEDCMAVYQMLGCKYPVVSVRGSSQAASNCKKAFEYLNSFDKIYLSFDEDDPGQKAQAEVAALFDPNKIYIVKASKHKDPSEFLQKGEQKAYLACWYNSKKHLPKGIIASYKDIEEILSRKSKEAMGTYPFQTLNEKLYGIRGGEVVLFKAQEKIGKTEIFRAIEHHLLKTTDENIALIHLEDNEKRTVQGIITYETGIPCHLPDYSLSNSDMLEAYTRATGGREERVHIYSHFGSDDPNTILAVIRYLVSVCGCRFVFLDHITMLVTGFEGEDERKKLDYISTRLAMMVHELDFCLFMISHVNDEGQTRGSRNISKVADAIISLQRNKEADDPEIRNTTILKVEGNRFSGKTGSGGVLLFDPETYTLSEQEREFDVHDF